MNPLVAIKLLHTLIWAVLAGAILALPVLTLRGRYRWAVIISVLIWLECGVLLLNQWRCPLTDVAACYTTARSDAFDIYLPPLLAHYNKDIFGSLFAASEILLLRKWVGSRRKARANDEGRPAS